MYIRTLIGGEFFRSGDRAAREFSRTFVQLSPPSRKGTEAKKRCPEKAVDVRPKVFRRLLPSLIPGGSVAPPRRGFPQ